MRIVRLLLLLTQMVESSRHWSTHVQAFRKRVPSELEKASKRRIFQVIKKKLNENDLVAKLDRLQLVPNPELRRSKKQVQGKRHHKRPRRHI